MNGIHRGKNPQVNKAAYNSLIGLREYAALFSTFLDYPPIRFLSILLCMALLLLPMQHIQVRADVIRH